MSIPGVSIPGRTAADGLLDTGDDVRAYLAEIGLLDGLRRTSDEVVEVRDVTAGNMNRVFVVTGSAGSLAVKQAPPFVQAAGPGWPMDPARIDAEARAYGRLQPIVPDAVPAVRHADSARHVLVMDDLSEFDVLRDVLVGQVADLVAGRAPRPLDLTAAARTVGRFVGALARATADTAIVGADREAFVAESANPQLCALTVDVVLDEPYREHEHNRWHPDLETRVRELHADARIAEIAAAQREVFALRREALLHGDLHTGSVMVNADGVKVFDPEFAFVGPIGLDLGLFAANCVIAAEAARAVGERGGSCEAARVDRDADAEADAGRVLARELADEREAAVETAWQAFTDAFTADGADAILAARLPGIRADAWRFAAAEAIRRVAGWSHAADLETLPSELVGPASARVFDRARAWLLTGADPGPARTSTPEQRKAS